MSVIVKVSIRQALQLPPVDKNCVRVFFARLTNQIMKLVTNSLVEMFLVTVSRRWQKHYRANAILPAQRQVVVQNFYILGARVGIIFISPAVDCFSSIQACPRRHETRREFCCHVRIVEIERLKRQFRVQIFRPKNLFAIRNRRVKVMQIFERDKVLQNATVIERVETLGLVVMKGVDREPNQRVFQLAMPPPYVTACFAT